MNIVGGSNVYGSLWKETTSAVVEEVVQQREQSFRPSLDGDGMPSPLRTFFELVKDTASVEGSFPVCLLIEEDLHVCSESSAPGWHPAAVVTDVASVVGVGPSGWVVVQSRTWLSISTELPGRYEMPVLVAQYSELALNQPSERSLLWPPRSHSPLEEMWARGVVRSSAADRREVLVGAYAEDSAVWATFEQRPVGEAFEGTGRGDLVVLGTLDCRSTRFKTWRSRDVMGCLCDVEPVHDVAGTTACPEDKHKKCAE